MSKVSDIGHTHNISPHQILREALENANDYEDVAVIFLKTDAEGDTVIRSSWTATCHLKLIGAAHNLIAKLLRGT